MLGGRLHLRQPRRGHRVGHDAILLAAATGGAYGERVIDLGAGVGVGRACAGETHSGAARHPGRDRQGLCELARQNVVLNRFDERVDIVRADAGHLDLPPGNGRPRADEPAFQRSGAGRMSRRTRRARALTRPIPTLCGAGSKSAARVLKPQGILTLIWRADGSDRRGQRAGPGFWRPCRIAGASRVRALPAIRVLVRAQKGGQAPLALLPGLELNDANGKPSAAAEAVLRGAEALPLANV